jgi:hypothetical protein
MRFTADTAKVLLFAMLVAAGCNADISEPMLRQAMTGEVMNEETLTQICGAPVSTAEARSGFVRVKFANVKASRPFTGKDGKGTADIDYTTEKGVSCKGAMSFDFHQEASEKRFTRRNASYSSQFELTNVVVRKR